jgi:quinol monooxygenase YgiN
VIVRTFDTAVDPQDIERGRQMFRDVVRPAFENFAGCRGIEMYLRVDERHGDLVDVMAISRWDSVEAMDAATSTEEYGEAMSEIRLLFQRSPIVRVFETVD